MDTPELSITGPTIYEYVGIPRKRAAYLYLHTIKTFRTAMGQKYTQGDLVLALSKITTDPIEATCLGFVAAAEYSTLTEYVHNQMIEKELEEISSEEIIPNGPDGYQ